MPRIRLAAALFPPVCAKTFSMYLRVASLSGRNPSELPTNTSEGFLPLREATRKYIEKVLAHTGGNKAAASRILGVSYRSMFRMLKGGEDDRESREERGTTVYAKFSDGEEQEVDG